MARNIRNGDTTGSIYMQLDCPMCDFDEVIIYASKPPEYCSDACKQRAYRRNLKIRIALSKTKFVQRLNTPQLEKHKQKIAAIVDEFGIEAAMAAIDLALDCSAAAARQVRKNLLGG